jgi:hypothetical protein
VKKFQNCIFAFFTSKPLPWLPVIVVSGSHDVLWSLGDRLKPVCETVQNTLFHLCHHSANDLWRWKIPKIAFCIFFSTNHGFGEL